MKSRIHPKVWIKWGDQGERVTVSEAARRIGIMPGSLWHRLERGVPREKLLSPGWSLRPQCRRKVKPEAAVAAPIPPPRPLGKRALVDAKRVLGTVKENGSPVRAAMNAELTAEEYLAAEAWRDLVAE